MTRNATLSNPASAASCVARTTCTGERVMPCTWAPGNLAARMRDVPPMPHPTSRMRRGGEAGAAKDSIASTKSTFAALKSFFK